MINRIKHHLELNPYEKPVLRVMVIVAILHTVLVIFLSPNQLKNDEPRYLTGAKNLSQGYFVTSEHPDFTNGPGYPLLLTPMVGLLGFDFDRLVEDPKDFEFYLPDKDGNYVENLKWKLFPLRLLNVLFLAAGFYCIYRAASLLVSKPSALLVTFLLSIYPFQLRFVPYLMTENVTPLLMGIFSWAYIKQIQQNAFSWKLSWIAGLSFCLLALTKTFFGYVALVAIVSIPIFCLLDGHKTYIKQAVAPFLIGLLLCIPYLAYTYKYTGKIFCWATNGSELAYWITSPHPDELGSWLQEKWIVGDPLLEENHLEFVRKVKALPYAQQDAAWMQGVKQNLQAENKTSALIRNYLANGCRMFFNMPRTKKTESIAKLPWVLTGGVILTLMGFCLLPTLMRWRSVPVELKLLLMCVGIYCCGTFILPAEPRYLIPVFPILFIWIAYVFNQIVRVKFEFRS